MAQDLQPRTTLYLIRHGATEANLARPPRIQGRRHNPPLARLNEAARKVAWQMLGPPPERLTEGQRR